MLSLKQEIIESGNAAADFGILLNTVAPQKKSLLYSTLYRDRIFKRYMKGITMLKYLLFFKSSYGSTLVDFEGRHTWHTFRNSHWDPSGSTMQIPFKTTPHVM